MLADIAQTLLDEKAILARMDGLAGEIVSDYDGTDLTVVGILTGSCLFLADLLRRMPIPLKVEFIAVASYHGGTRSSGVVSIQQTAPPDVRGRRVLLVDDILDTGRTLAAVRALLEKNGALEVRTCVLLDKDVPREREAAADYTGFHIADAFVVGYGLDYMGHYRNLPFIGILQPEAIARLAAGISR